MTESLRLPERVSRVTVPDDLVERIESGQAILDWTDVTEVDVDTLRTVLAPFLDRIEEFEDALGVMTMQDVIEPFVDHVVADSPLPEPGPAAWTIAHNESSRYGDSHGEHYEYKQSLPNGKRMSAGDHAVCVLSAKAADDDRQVFGVARIAEIVDAADGLVRAIFDDYVELDPAVPFVAVGGDPRPNTNNSINRVPVAFAERVRRVAAGVGVDESEPALGCALPKMDLTTPRGVRDAFHSLVELDLLGPACGEHEELLDDPPKTRYVVGTLAARNAQVDQMVQDDQMQGAGEAKDGQEGDVETVTTVSDTLFSSTIGFTFEVEAGVGAIRLEARWGAYDRVQSELHFTDDGNPRMVWKRSPRGGVQTLELTPGPVGPLVLDPEHEKVVVRGRVRPPSATGTVLVTLFLINDQTEPDSLKDKAWIFQPELSVTATDETAAVFVRRDEEADLDLSTGDPEVEERALLSMVHRRHAEFAVGHGVAVHATPSGDPWLADSGWDKASRVQTAVLPSYDVPVTETPGDEELADDFPGFEGFELDMNDLATKPESEVITALERIPATYQRWIDARRASLNDGTRPDLERHREAAELALDRADKARQRLAEGVQLLADDPQAFRAFQFMNRSMRLQRLRSVFALRRRRGDELEFSELEATEPAAWRTFQLAFILLNLVTVTKIDHPRRNNPVGAYADLLWFPTGGGKTEAYLGVAAYSIAIRRLQGEVDGHRGDGGVSVIMRYTLRLLTLQQFQRASTLVCAMEYVRRAENDGEQAPWGREPFRIGLWVGNSSTPGTTGAAARWLNANRGEQKWDAGAGTSSPLQLTNCPWCGEKLGPDNVTCETYASGRGRTLLHCRNRECDFTKRISDEGIPVVTVDEEIYRLVPTFLLATVDKFAQMPWRGEVQSLFGRVHGFCPRHGWLGNEHERDCGGLHKKKGSLPATSLEPAPTNGLRPPDLVIQDELHLISGPLGTLVGLYETAIDELCTWETDGHKVRPKVIASTATTRRAPEQVHQLFCRQVEIFPPLGLDATDNFFARQRSPVQKPGRRYMGVCAPGRSRPSVLIRVYVALLTSAQWLWENVEEEHREHVDPYMTLVGYFNSLRELGGMSRLVTDDVSTRVFRIERGDRPGLAQRVMYPESTLAELTSRVRSSKIPEVLDRLEQGFEVEDDDKGRKKQRPLDVALATNMLSVGVDVQRLGVMAVSGQPKATAEYIQATSRVGRSKPGFVVTFLNWARPRDLSHYEQFEHYHAVFYRYVEALSVTPFAPRALDRGLTGVLASLVRLDGTDLNHNHGAGSVKGAGQLPEVAATLGDRAQNATFPDEEHQQVGAKVTQRASARLDQWGAEAARKDRKLGYRKPRTTDDVTVPLLHPPGKEPWGPFTTPVSLREVEAGVGLILSSTGNEMLPAWGFAPPADDEDDE